MKETTIRKEGEEEIETKSSSSHKRKKKTKPRKSSSSCCCTRSFCDYFKRKPDEYIDDIRIPSITFQPYHVRRCTDLFFFFLYILSWAGLLAIIITARKQGGNADKIIHSVDYHGEICGTGEHVLDKPYAAWVVMPDPFNPFSSQKDCTDCFQIRTCVKDCGYTLQDPNVLDKYQSEPLLYLCIPVPSSSVSPQLPNTTFRGQFPYSSTFNSVTELASRSYTDLFIGWPIILGSAGLALLFSYFYTWLTSKWVKVLFLFAVIFITAGGGLLSYVLLENGAQLAATVSPERELAVEILGITVAIITFFFLVFLFLIRTRIAIAIEIIREGANALKHMKWLLIFPLFPFLVGLGYFILFMVGTLWVGSVWTVTFKGPLPPYIIEEATQQNRTELASLSTPYYTYSYNQTLKNSFAYLLLHLLWTIQILIYFTYTVISTAVSRWYFLPRIRTASGKIKRKLPLFPILYATKIILRYHLGTICLSALIVAFTSVLRAIIKYMDRIRCIKGQREPNAIQICLSNIMNYFTYCSKCCLDYVNKKALVWTGLYGDPFMISAKSSFTLLFSNLIRLGTVSVIGTYIMFLGKLLVSSLTAGVFGILILHFYGKVMNSVVLPIVIIFLLAYMVASLSMTIVETIIDTVFIAFLVDEHVNGASTEQMFASPVLKKILYTHALENQSAYDRAVQARNTNTTNTSV